MNMPKARTRGLHDPRLRPWAVSLTLVLLVLAALETAWGIRDFKWGDTPGIDLGIYLRATSRLFAGDSWFLDRQLGGPYLIHMGDVLYPPVTAFFFAPFFVLPSVLWWAIPIGLTAGLIIGWRPAPWAWPLMALCILWPLTPAKTITGNPALWITAFVAAGLRWHWPSALVLLKPSLFPFALIGVRHRLWWVTVACLALGSVIWFDATRVWLEVLANSQGGGLLYSAVDIPMLLIPVIAWAGRTRERTPDRATTDGTTVSAEDEAGSRARQHTSLTVVLPAYNESSRIGVALDELFGYLHRRGAAARDGAPGAGLLPDRVDVLVVDDGSTDGTADIVRARPEARPRPGAAPELTVLSLPHAGKGGAVRSGMLAAQTDLIAFTDADLATPPDMLPLLVQALADYDVALGSRIQPDGRDMRRSQPLHRRLFGQAFHGLASAWAVGPVRDTQCGFKGFTRAAAHDLFSRQRITSIAFDVEIIYLARRWGYGIKIVPILWSDRHGSRLKASPRLALRVVWDLLRIPFLHRRSSSVSRTAAVERSEGVGDG